MIVSRLETSRAARRPVRPAAGWAVAAAAFTLLVLPAPASAQHHSAAPGLPRGIPAFCSDATVVSAGSGAWSDPNTWSPTGVPASGARVRIGAGHDVSYDVVGTDSISCIVVDGALRFRTDTNTLLTVGTMLVMDGGELEIGTEFTPVEAQVRAELVIANQAIDNTLDPEQYGTGLLAFGKVHMHGAVKWPTFARLAFDRRRGTGEPLAGDTVLNLDEDQIGWEPGDQLILPDTRQLGPGERFQNASFHQAERLTTQSIEFASITLAAPLQFDHAGARDAVGRLDRTPHVGNLTRNVIIRSADPQGVRGHTLYTQQADVDIRYVQFQDMGRTSNEQPIDSTTFDAGGNVVHIGANQNGRHPINLHHLRGPANPGGKLRTYQFVLVGNAVVDSRKAPITVRQSHYGIIQDNVIFNATGAGIMTADGNESYNEFLHNFVVGIVGRGNRNDPTRLPDDGSDGAAFWFKGFNNAVWSNVAANVINHDPSPVNSAGFAFAWPAPLHGSEVKIPVVKGADLSDPNQYFSINMLHLPLFSFDANEAYGAMTAGLTLQYLGTDGRNTDLPAQESFVTNFTAWHIHEAAFFGFPTNKVTFDWFTVRGHRSGLGPDSTTAGFAFGEYKNRDVTIRNADIQGMNTGINLSQATEGTFLIETSRLQNYYSNISAMTLETAGTMVPVSPDGRATIVRGVDFAPMPPLGDPADRPFVAVSRQWNDTPRNPTREFYWDQLPDTLVIHDYSVDGVPTGESYQLFYPPQETRNIAGGLATCSSRPKDEFEGIVYVNGLPEFTGPTIACNLAGEQNNPPVALDDFAITNAGAPVVIDVLANDSDPDHDSLSLTNVSDPAHGSAQINGSTILYTPDAGFAGDDSFTYTIDDGRGAAVQAGVSVLVNAPVNNPPTAVDDTVSLDEDSGSVTLDLLANDTTDPGETLVLVSVVTPAHGTLGPAGESAQLLYTPNADFCGVDSFEYRISDGSSIAVGTVTVNVACVNDLPRPQPDFFAIAEDSVEHVLDVLNNDVDDGPFLVLGCFAEAVNNLHGTVTIAPNGTHVIYTPDPNFFGIASFICKVTDGSGPGIDQPGALVTVNVANVNDPPTAVDDALTVNEDSAESAVPVLANDLIAPDHAEILQIVAVGPAQHGVVVLGGEGRQLIYKPQANFCGEDSFGYTITDGHGGTDIGTATITVTCVNDVPQPLDDVVTISEDSGDVVIDVLKNDVNVDGANDPLRVAGCFIDIGRGDNPHGAFRVAPDGSHVIYTPEANFFGTAAFGCIIGDSIHGGANAPTSRVTITITSVNDPPSAGDDTVSLDEDSGSRVVNVLANDTTAPDPGETLSILSFGTAQHGTVGIGGESAQLLYTPNADFCGVDSFNYTISDGSLTDIATVTVTVACVNDLPRPQPDVFVVAEDSVDNLLDVLRNDVDVDGSQFFVLGCFAEGADNRHGTVSVAANGTHVVYTPDPNFFGTASFVCRVTEGFGPGADQPSALVTVNVTPVNDAPVAANDSYTLDRRANTVLSISAPGILGNDIDGENATLTAVQVSGPANGTLTLNADGSFTYTPNPNFLGSDSFTYRAFDGSASSELATVSIAVNEESVSATVDAGGTASTDSEADGATPEDPVETSVTLPAGVAGSVSIAEAAVTEIEPAGFTFFGQQVNIAAPTATAAAPLVLVFRLDASIIPAGHDLSLQVFRNGAAVATCAAGAGMAASPDPCVAARQRHADGDVEVTVRTSAASNWNFGTSDNTAPVAVNDKFETEADTPVTGNVLANDYDLDTDPLTAVLVGAPLAGLTLNADGSFTYTPAAGVTGPVTFSYKASDGRIESNVATVAITIKADDRNREPWLADMDDDWWYEGDAIWIRAWAGDPDRDSLTFSAQGLPPGIQINPKTGEIFGMFQRIVSVGIHKITITVSDGRLSANETVTWTIREKNRAPWMPRPRDQKNFEHDTVFFQFAGADPDWDPITFTATNLPPGVVVDPDGTVHGHLPLGSAGTYTVTVKISDGRKSATQTFKWVVRKQPN
jgi:hypothetical protein